MATVSSVTYDLLRAHGLTTIFGNPGSNELPFLAGMPDDFNYVLGLHEGAVLSMADGYSLATGAAVFVNLHAASGSGNAMGALTNSVYSHSPLVVTAGQQVRAMIGQEVMLANVDAGNLMKPLVKWSAEPTCPEDVPRVMSQAIHTAMLPARGPVYVSVPYDDWAQEAPDEAYHLLAHSTTAASDLSESQIDELVDALDTAMNPVLVLGPAVDAEHANDLAVELAEKLSAPVWMAPSSSRCSFPTRHASFRGMLPTGIGEISTVLDGYDLVIVIGAPVFRYHQYIPGRYLPDGASLIHITDDADEAARAPMGTAYIAPIRGALSALAKRVTTSTRPPLEPLPDYPTPAPAQGALRPEMLFALIREAAPEDTIYVNESTSTAQAFWSQMNLSKQGSFYFPASGGLGFGLPAAVGIALAQDRPVVGLIGDGSANYGITALWTAAQYEIPVVFVILKNGTYGALRGFGALLKTGETPGLDVPGLDFVKIAQGYGVDSIAVDTEEDFTAAFTTALAQRRPYLIEVTTTFDRP
ncbi:benzoylformate decarboxylase (plasmid) [Rhodococcus sp. USK10]|uniref:benzoylformate decarboxylase n=1 Tax=Rhodococcus sp. USK10 TaxID=2789739 RepID=UPI001C5D7036|nr:benzoylformate decarboxylase [Rhodococcus sp. USK10]QYB00246.1 benzoylformate decarboxylase [Rhodococcus sp. USK10]